MRGPDSQSGIMAFAMSGRSNSAEGKAKDVLAAEAFAVPAADPNLHPRGPILVPEDPSGIEEPHDVLAAEEFAMPASPRPRVSSTFTRPSEAGIRTRLAVAAGVLLALRALRRRSRS